MSEETEWHIAPRRYAIVHYERADGNVGYIDLTLRRETVEVAWRQVGNDVLLRVGYGSSASPLTAHEIRLLVDLSNGPSLSLTRKALDEKLAVMNAYMRVVEGTNLPKKLVT